MTQERTNEMENIRRLGTTVGPLIAAALLIWWAYWTSLSGVAHP